MNLPNFLIIGGQRCGTTWLYQVLRRHPEVYMPKQKELEFFSYPDRMKELGIAGYSMTHFSKVRNEVAIGEASPSYLWTSDAFVRWRRKPPGLNPDIPGSVHEHLGSEVKLVVTLRNPVKRAISAYFHHMRMGRLERNQSIIEKGRMGGIVHLGFYHEHLRPWLDRFDRSNFKILIFEESIRDPESAFATVFEFLGIGKTDSTKAMSQAYTQGYPTVERHGNIYLAKTNVKTKEIDSLEDDQLDLVISAEDIDRLKTVYRRDALKLSKLLKKDLVSDWLS